jgi:hypothetical protein
MFPLNWNIPVGPVDAGKIRYGIRRAEHFTVKRNLAAMKFGTRQFEFSSADAIVVDDLALVVQSAFVFGEVVAVDVLAAPIPRNQPMPVARCRESAFVHPGVNRSDMLPLIIEQHNVRVFVVLNEVTLAYCAQERAKRQDGRKRVLPALCVEV